MRVVALFLFVVTAAITLCRSESSTVESCPPYDVLEKIVYLPHPRDCSLFRRCQAGEAILGHCPQGQHFNPNSSSCEEPAKAGCEDAGGAGNTTEDACPTAEPRSTCRYQCSCSKKPGGNSTCPTKLEFSPGLEVFDKTSASCPTVVGALDLSGDKLGRLVTANATANASSCPANGTGDVSLSMPHFADCSKMVVCSGGSEQTHECPEGQLYSPDIGLCDAPEFVECLATTAPATAGNDTGGHCPTLGTCEHTCRCSVVQGGCPASISFTASFSIFDAEKNPQCSQEAGAIDLGGGLFGNLTVSPNTTQASRCPPGSTGRVYVPDPTDCGKVTLCVGGRERTLNCPSGLHFNPSIKSCGPPDPTKCADGKAPPTTPAPTTPAPSDPTTDTNATAARDDAPCSTTWACPAGKNSSVPHLSDCTMFCRCEPGGPFLGACPPGLHYSMRAKACEHPIKANCLSTCPQISANERGEWLPEDCTGQDSQEGVECRLTCDSAYQLIGSEVINCTTRGWYGSGGLNHIPSCNTPDEFAEAVVNKINETLTNLSDNKTGIIFILDESLSVDPAFYMTNKSENFQSQKNLVSCLVTGFPLSDDRSAGVITFSARADVDIGLRQTSTCDFVSQLRGVPFFGGETDLAAALDLAAAEINSTSPPRKTLVLIVTDGQSQTDPAPAAASLRQAGHVVFAIAVADFDRHQLEPISSTHSDGSKLFFALPDFRLFRHLEFYLREKYNESATVQCP